MPQRGPHEVDVILAAGPMTWIDRLAARLPEFERDRLTAAEVCIDEALSIMDRRSDACGPFYDTLSDISAMLSNALLIADGADNRLERLRRVRDTLDSAFQEPHAQEERV